MKVTEKMLGAFMNRAFLNDPFPSAEEMSAGIQAALAEASVSDEMADTFAEASGADSRQIDVYAGLEAVFRADV